MAAARVRDGDGDREVEGRRPSRGASAAKSRHYVVSCDDRIRHISLRRLCTFWNEDDVVDLSSVGSEAARQAFRDQVAIGGLKISGGRGFLAPLHFSYEQLPAVE